MPVWSIPMVYTAVSLACGLILPRLEHFYLGSYSHAVSVGAALAFYSSVSSGMMALTGLVFAIAFVMKIYCGGLAAGSLKPAAPLTSTAS